MDDKSLEILDFPQIRQILAGFTSFSAGRQLALELQPSVDHQHVVMLLQQSAEARRLLAIEAEFSIGTVSDIRHEVELASIGKVLEPQNLVEIQQTLAAIHQVRSCLKELSEKLPLLWNIAAPLVELHDVVRNIAHCLSPGGEVLDRASEHLASLRRELVESRRRLLESLEAIMKTPHGQRTVQEPVIFEREGRYVIPVKIEHRRDIKGIVHDVSNTGATVFVEPWATIELGSALRETVVEEKREVERILQRLSAEVGSHEEEISRNIALTAELDLALAKARYARQAKAVEPVVVDVSDDRPAAGEPAGVLRLLEARHPLLGDAAVPLSVEIGRDFLALVITGPNTGGKTVALKTIGLLSLMTQAGIPIPASAGSQIPLFDNIFADIGDQQSIESTLSSFSWHMGNIVRIVRQGTGKSLVVLDELGGSTDPVEGAALAIAILRYFLKRGAMTVATTHFGEVKAFAHVTAGIQNASFDFDPVTLTPTYHLTTGIAGGSNALAVATRLGLPAEIISEAERILPEGVKELETLLVSLKSKEQEISVLQRRLEREREEAARQRSEMEAERQQSKADVRRTILEARDKVTLEVAELHRQIRDVAAELRKEKSRDRLESARKALSAVREHMESGALKTQENEPPAGGTFDGGAIAPGDTVWVREANVMATVLAVSEARREVELAAGSARMRLSLDKVDRVSENTVRTVREAIASRLPRPSVSRELDLRGKRADEVEPALDKYLNDASLANLSEGRIIHGFGTGTVRQIVRDMLASHPLVKSFRPGGRGEGGDGVTVVQVQNAD
ncbi:MAG: endonuclease MutS2 [Dehalococcoidia bacterium]|nr:endonuclease MutS2 [Dehalococcoidia bacterium]